MLSHTHPVFHSNMKRNLNNIKIVFNKFIHHDQIFILCIATCLSAFFITFYFHQGLTLAYGDAESHLNIAKRVVDSLTPGIAQLGGVWLPLPHLMMIPFIMQDTLWRTGLGGAIVSGICFIISALTIYKTTFLLTKNKAGSFLAFLLFSGNANILYMQSTPMSELPLIVFFTLSLYYFFRFLEDDTRLLSLIGAGLFGFCATLTRYDGWFLVGFELLALLLFYLKKGFRNHIMEGKGILFSTIGFFGIILWLIWDKLILGDAFYFTNSPFSAKSQQQGWMMRGELPAYKNLWEAFLYYSVTSLENIGILLFALGIIGLILFLFDKKQKNRFLISLLLLVPFVFYVATLYLGQSVIFIPDLTPSTYQWRLFNVRYGIMMVPVIAVFFGYLYNKLPYRVAGILVIFLFVQYSLFFIGKSPILTLEDGTYGLSASSHPDAERWIRKNYDKGYVLLDDYARTLSITGSDLPIQNVIYIGNKPYWDEALDHPEEYVQWVVLQKGDAVWKSIYDNPTKKAELYKYFVKAYTSPNILVFKRNDKVASAHLLSEK